MCVLLSCYRTFCYKISDSRKKEKKRVKLMIVQAFNWLIRHLIYYLCIDKCSYMGQ